MKYILLFILFLVSCTKEEQVKQEISNPVLIQIEAVHVDGNIELSPIVLVR